MRNYNDSTHPIVTNHRSLKFKKSKQIVLKSTTSCEVSSVVKINCVHVKVINREKTWKSSLIWWKTCSQMFIHMLIMLLLPNSWYTIFSKLQKLVLLFIYKTKFWRSDNERQRQQTSSCHSLKLSNFVLLLVLSLYYVLFSAVLDFSCFIYTQIKWNRTNLGTLFQSTVFFAHFQECNACLHQVYNFFLELVRHYRTFYCKATTYSIQ